MRKSATSHTICPGCGQKAATVRAIPAYHYKESGLDNVWLRGGVTETRCESCKSEFVRITREPQLLQVIALTLLMEPGYRTGPELRFLRRACGLTQDDLAKLLDLRRPTIAEREAKRDPGLGFAEDVGMRVVLVKALQRYITHPGNSALNASHRKTLWDFANFLAKVTGDTPKKTRRPARITARVQRDSWTVETPKKAA
jgi:DNA-binding XRE family transcriptional regulator